MRVPRPLIRFAVTAFQRARRLVWFFTRPKAFGVHAVPLTPEGKIVLVRLTYAEGWRLPGGGRKPRERKQDGVLRELREEIGLTAHGAVRQAFELSSEPDFRRDLSTYFVVEGVEYAPKQSLEVEAVAEFDPDDLPADMPATDRWVVGEVLKDGAA